MKRVVLGDEGATNYFDLVRHKSHLSLEQLCSDLGVSKRMFSYWRKEKYTFSETVSTQIDQKYGVSLPGDAKLIEVSEQRSISGRKGGIARFKLYGDPGTPEGRRKGGLNSLTTHKTLNTGFITRKPFKVPMKSGGLAEVFGIMIGDGGLTHNQARITLGARDDAGYSLYVMELLNTVLGIKPSLKNFTPGTIDIYISGRGAVEFFYGHGLPIGNKVRQNHGIPEWILNDSNFSIAALRGIFDTDGCVFLDKHKIKGRLYRNIGLAYTTYSPGLRIDISEVLNGMGMSPTLTSENRVMLRKKKDIELFWNIIRPANLKHINRYSRFLEECREW